jgi:PmbA protein
MIGAGELRSLARSVAGSAPPACDVEVFASQVTDTTVRIQDQEVQSLEFSESCGVGIRVVRDSRLGFASTVDLSRAGLGRAMRQAAQNARFAPSDHAHDLPQPRRAGSAVCRTGRAGPARPDELIRRGLELERLTLAAHPEIVQVAPARIGHEISQVAVVSSTGVDAAWERGQAYATASALAQRDGAAETGLGFGYGSGVEDLNLPLVAAEAAVRARRLLGGGQTLSGMFPIVLDPLATARFLKAFARAFSGRAASEGTTPFSGLAGERVAADCVTLVDDGRLAGELGSAQMDDEGVPRQRTVLIGSGRLLSFLHNTESAARTGAPGSTGNARRTDFRGLPGIGATNLFFDGKPGEPADIIGRVGHGVYALDVKGLHAGHNSVTSDFSVGISGHVIRHGEIAEPIRQTVISADLLTLLDSVQAIGSDRRFYPLDNAMGGATLLAGPVAVTGGQVTAERQARTRAAYEGAKNP